MSEGKTIEDLEQEVGRRTEEYFKKRTEFISDIEKEQRRARLIEKYFDENIKPLLKETDAVGVKASYSDIDDAVKLAVYIADAIIKATEEK